MSFSENMRGLGLLFNLVVRPKAYVQSEINRILDEQYDNLVIFWPEKVRFVNDPANPYSTRYVTDFPETPSAFPENLGGTVINRHATLQLTPVRKKWLTEKFMTEVERKITNLQRAANFPECTLNLNGFNHLKNIANGDSNDKMAIDLGVHMHISGKKSPAPQQ